MKKLFGNPLITAFIGLFVGGMLVFVYFSKFQKIDASSSGNAILGSTTSSTSTTSILSATTPNEAKNMINSLYKFILSNPKDVGSLFQKSYALKIDDIRPILLVKRDSGDTLDVKARIYPALRKLNGKNILSFILMVEKNGVMQWDSLNATSPQPLIQDQWAPCPTECPGGGGGIDKGKDLFTEANWVKVMNGTYKKK